MELFKPALDQDQGSRVCQLDTHDQSVPRDKNRRCPRGSAFSRVRCYAAMHKHRRSCSALPWRFPHPASRMKQNKHSKSIGTPRFLFSVTGGEKKSKKQKTKTKNMMTEIAPDFPAHNSSSNTVNLRLPHSKHTQLLHSSW